MSQCLRLGWALSLGILTATRAHAETPATPFLDPETQQRLQAAEDYARKAADELMRSLEELRQSIPSYGAPYIDRNGDIVIPRLPRHGAPAGMPMPDIPPDRT